MTREEVHTIANDVKKTYSKDYFEGMKHFADIVLCELGKAAEYYDDMSRTYKGSQECYNYCEKAIDEAMGIINAVLHSQLEAEEEEPEIDWSQVTVNTPLLVKDSEDEIWHIRYFAKYENGIVYAWREEDSIGWTETCMKPWKFAKLEEEEE